MGIGVIRGMDSGPRCDLCNEVMSPDDFVHIRGTSQEGAEVDARYHPGCFEQTEHYVESEEGSE